MACIACGRGFFDECYSPTEDNKPCGMLEESATGALTEGLVWQKDDNEVSDPKSTGRKRAAKLYPLDRDKPCEWKGLKFAGGGKPIIGCVNGLQRQRHHGPNKDTLDNSPGNVHRICDNCHARWHTINDDGYDWNEEDRMPHDPETFASVDDLAQNEIYWASTKTRAIDGGKGAHD